MKNANDTIGNRTRDLPNCSAVPQPTALPRTPTTSRAVTFFIGFLSYTGFHNKGSISRRTGYLPLAEIAKSVQRLATG